MDGVAATKRIDAGIKRGPRPKPQKPLQAPRSYPGLALRPLSQLSPETRQDIANTVLDRYINGEQIAAIAPEYNVSDVTIYALLLREHQDKWVGIQSARALARLDRGQHELRVAPDALSLARAREEVRSAQWELERLINRLYGQKQEVTVTNVIQISSVLDGLVDKLLDRIAAPHQLTQVIDLPSDAVQQVIEPKP